MMSDDEIFIKKEKKKKRADKKKKVEEKVNNAFDSDDPAIKKLADELIVADKELEATPVVKVESADEKRSELIKAAEDGYIDKKVEYLKKCSVKIIDKIYLAYELKRKKDADMFLTDLLISQFSDILGGLDAIEDPESLTDELKKNTLMKKDIEKAIGFISPYVPLVGILSGIAVTGKHIYKHKISDNINPARPAESV